MVDDLDSVDLSLFPNISEQMVRQGASFDRFFVSNSWCCPSRASVLRSQYVHSHEVYTNTAPEGGFARFYKQGLERSTIGTWMQEAGYRTGLMGKYLNHYPGMATHPTYVPPGWDEWDVPVTHLYREYRYTMNENGSLRDYGDHPQDYLTDVLSVKAREFVRGEAPFFLYLAPVAPHAPANPAWRHAGAFSDVMAPRTPSFDQEDVEAEPAWLRALPRMSEHEIAQADERYRARLRAMLGVDDMVGALVEELRTAGRLADTYLFFTSDNGYHLGQHRLRYGKTSPYEEDIRVPMVVRGPGVPAGSKVSALSATVDLAPTFAELAGAEVPGFAEGRSLAPLLAGRTPESWRKNVLVEFYRPPWQQSTPSAPVPPYRALRTARYTYVEYDMGERQLYDLVVDPHQLHNIADEAPHDLIAGLRDKLREMARCSGASCRVADAR
ncbi:sulfatase [Microtetraspora sp. NBRC 13810]|uniref:sulfatase family protein n=1 Tax=Microtetraspora sp. NBRC 13810 TaxID=3030990 RepID=UPI0025555A3D|nr:sulfatase [Microtetraspora sp. NBRC 13810]